MACWKSKANLLIFTISALVTGSFVALAGVAFVGEFNPEPAPPP